MISALSILLVSALLCWAMGAVPRWAPLAWIAAALGMAVALVVAVYSEALSGGGAVGISITWPQTLNWLGAPVFVSDGLAAGLGAWCLVIGGLHLLRLGLDRAAPAQLASSTLAVATLYGLVYTADMRILAGEVLLLVLLVCVWQAGDSEDIAGARRSLFALGLGALLLLSAVLLVGRATGGLYGLASLSLATMTAWLLILFAGFLVLWLGMVPFTGWSAQGLGGGRGAMLQSLVIGVPAVTLLLRLQALVTAQTLGGSLPEGWGAFTGTLAWVGGLTAIIAGAGMVVWAGTSRWAALLTAHVMGLTIWALALDNPLGRMAAIVILLAYGAARTTLEFAPPISDETIWNGVVRAIARFSLLALPLTAGFVGVWLLGTALGATGRSSLLLVLAGVVALAAAGSALHWAQPTGETLASSRLIAITGVLLAATLLVGGALPSLWVPQAKTMASIAGGGPLVDLPWFGIAVGAETAAPLVLLALAAAVLLGLTWLVTLWARSSAGPAGVLRPTALERLANAGPPAVRALIIPNPPAPIWWLSLTWLEMGIVGFGRLLDRLTGGAGLLLGRLEGRFYLPLALIFILIALLAVVR
jgi:hypothetical protein